MGGDRRRRALIIVNRAAGGFSRRRIDRVVAALHRRGCAAEQRHAGPGLGDAERIAREAGAEFDVIVAAGGDGTINAVVNGLAAGARPGRALALLPCGTVNVLAREIGLPRHPEQLAELIAGGPARPIWPGRAGSRLFLTTASSGFDADVVAAVDPRLKRLAGRAAFAWAIAGCLAHYRERRLAVGVDGAEYRAAAVIAAKSRLYAGPFTVAARADVAAPTLELVLFQSFGRAAVLRYLVALLLGRVPQCEDVVVLRCRAAVIISSGEPGPVQADGEIIGCLPIALGVSEQPILLVRP